MPTAANYLILALSTFFIACQSSPTKHLTNATAQKSQPNIIYILADDLGYAELGCYGQSIIETPHLDQLAESGMKFTQHYSGAPVCAPARCILLTGMHAGHAYIRGNDEWGSRGDVWDYDAMYADSSLEGQRPIADTVLTIAEVLQEQGYQTGMVGKWGLGAPGTEGVPTKQGFDFFYGYNCQRQAHTFYPRHLWRNEDRHLLDNKSVAPHTRFDTLLDPHDEASYADFNLNDYSPALMHTEAIDFMTRSQDQPFFLYYASPIPHLPLQAPDDWLSYYRDKLGPEEPYTGKSYFPHRTPKAAYAAMVSYLDEQVGDLVRHLKDLGVYENTLIVFSSDNGPSYTGGTDSAYFDSAHPFRSGYGYGKGFTHEGGIRVPMIVSWPDQVAAGIEVDHLSAFYDIFPTFCDVAGASCQPTDGLSLYPTLTAKGQQQRHEFLYWEFPAYTGQQAVRMGEWKGIRKNLIKGEGDLELYNLNDDIEESDDVSAQYPEVVQKIQKIMKAQHSEAQNPRYRMAALGDKLTD